MMMELGWFGPQPKPHSIPVLANGQISRDIAAQSMVLLKNEAHLLPLDRDRLKKVALIGPCAVRQMTGGGGSSHVIPLYSVAPVDGLDHALLSQTKILLLDGNDIEAAVTAAKSSDVAILMVGDDEGEDHDHGIALPEQQNRLIAAVAAANPKTILVLKSGSAVLMPWIDSVPAILEAWYPGEEDGNAVADVLFGKVNPSGKLPLTFPRATSDTLAATPARFPGDGKTVTYSEGLGVGYRAFVAHDVTPLFPFGFGLSYTQFQFSGLKAARGPNHTAVVRFTLTNIGDRVGAEVAQLYLTYPHIPEGDEPPRQLRGFRKLTLKPHESQTVQLSLNMRAFSFWSEKTRAWTIPEGAFGIFVGDSSAETPLATTMTFPKRP
jgi:beta-glucosidase